MQPARIITNPLIGEQKKEDVNVDVGQGGDRDVEGQLRLARPLVLHVPSVTSSGCLLAMGARGYVRCGRRIVDGGNYLFPADIGGAGRYDLAFGGGLCQRRSVLAVHLRHEWRLIPMTKKASRLDRVKAEFWET